MHKHLLSIIFLIAFNNGYCSDSTYLSGSKIITGVYQSGDELLNVMSDNTFYLKRIAPKYQNDVVLPICYDTIAKGNWVLAKEGVLKLANDSDFEKIYFDIKQQKNFPKTVSIFKYCYRMITHFLTGDLSTNCFFYMGWGVIT